MWWCGGVYVVVFLWWCFCGGVFVWWCFCSGVVFLWCFCGGVCVLVFLWCFRLKLDWSGGNWIGKNGAWRKHLVLIRFDHDSWPKPLPLQLPNEPTCLLNSNLLCGHCFPILPFHSSQISFFLFPVPVGNLKLFIGHSHRPSKP